MAVHQYEVVGRHKPTEADPNPKVPGHRCLRAKPYFISDC